MNHIAKALARKGRNGDTELLHVTKGEIKALKGLAKAHGLRSLPINPATGLHEASFLEDFVSVAAPVALGVGGFMIGGGPVGASAGAALGSKLTGGSDREAMMWGLGGYGAGVGATHLATVAAEKVAAANLAAAAGGGAGGAAGVGGAGVVGGAVAPVAPVVAAPAAPVPVVAAVAPAAAPVAAVPAAAAPAADAVVAEAAAKKAAETSYWEWMKSNPGTTLMGGMALNSLLNPDKGYTPSAHTTSVPGVSTSTRTRLATPTIGPSGQRTYFADNRPSANAPTGPNRQYTQVYAKGGRVGIRGESMMDPVYLRGDGDGMSDSIPGRITSTGEPIAVADGEYVIPADAVSHFGNGSSNAGAKKLDTMVAGIRKLRTGKKKQAPAVNAAKVMRV